MVTKNKTGFRPSLKLDGTLSSILTTKLADPEPCFKYEPTSAVLETAKRATMEYNRAHSSQSELYLLLDFVKLLYLFLFIVTVEELQDVIFISMSHSWRPPSHSFFFGMSHSFACHEVGSSAKDNYIRQLYSRARTLRQIS